MAKITCDVIKDILPLYVDDVLSYDSKELVDEHISTCGGCKDYYQKLKSREVNCEQVNNINDKAALKRIRKSINKKRLITAIITAAGIAAITSGLFYGTVFHEKYIPYEETGLYVSDDALRSDREFYKSSGIYTPDGETLFLYMTTTTYTELKGNDGMETGTPIIDLTDEGLTMQSEDENGNVTEQVCEEIYYLSEQNVKQLIKNLKWTDDNIEDEIEDLKGSSVLIWRSE